MSRKIAYVLTATLIATGLVGGTIASSASSQGGDDFATGICCNVR